MARILLVEDDHLLSSILAGSLRDARYEVMCAYDGDSAVARAIERHFDLMLLDILLPGKDGFEVITTMKSMTATKEIPVVVISNLSDEKTVERMKAAGSAGYIVKMHTTPQEVIEKVHEILQAHTNA